MLFGVGKVATKSLSRSTYTHITNCIYVPAPFTFTLKFHISIDTTINE